MHTCYVIDDEDHAVDTLVKYINKFPDLNLIGSNTNPLKAINEIRNADHVDMVFLDVDMPELSGMEVAVEAFEKNGSDFILKPVSFERFAKSVTKVQKLINPKPSHEHNPADEHFFINPGIKGRMIQLTYADILYIEGLKNYVVIYTIDNKYITYLSMKEIENAIPLSRFVRIHKSFIVNIDQIKSIDGNNVIMSQSGELAELPIGTLFKDNFLHIINSKALRSRRKN